MEENHELDAIIGGSPYADDPHPLRSAIADHFIGVLTLIGFIAYLLVASFGGGA